MKRSGNLYDSILSYQNLLLASKKAQVGKRFEDNVGRFNFSLEKQLLKLSEELQEHTYYPVKYKSFYIYEPKKRMISAAPYRDRVVHHALCNIIEPIFEKTFIEDSYANRKGKGTHKAIERFQSFAKKNKYALKADIKKYFPSIDHEILKSLIKRKIKCNDTVRLIDDIIDNSNLQEPVNEYYPSDDLFTLLTRRKGIPIGNLTSQFFANIYLNPLDHYIKEKLKCKYYIRYVDDFVIFDNDITFLHDCHKKINEFLIGLRLTLHENKTKVFQVKEGMSFLGHRIFPDFRLLKNENVRRFRKRMRKQMTSLQSGNISPYKFGESLQSWMAHASWSDTYRLRNKIIDELKGIDALKPILRGGAFNNNPINLRTANRNRNNPENSNNNNGFRIASTFLKSPESVLFMDKQSGYRISPASIPVLTCDNPVDRK